MGLMPTCLPATSRLHFAYTNCVPGVEIAGLPTGTGFARRRVFPAQDVKLIKFIALMPAVYCHRNFEV